MEMHNLFYEIIVFKATLHICESGHTGWELLLCLVSIAPKCSPLAKLITWLSLQAFVWAKRLEYWTDMYGKCNSPKGMCGETIPWSGRNYIIIHESFILLLLLFNMILWGAGCAPETVWAMSRKEKSSFPTSLLKWNPYSPAVQPIA
jgi:hypothetical protein